MLILAINIFNKVSLKDVYQIFAPKLLRIWQIVTVDLFVDASFCQDLIGVMQNA